MISRVEIGIIWNKIVTDKEKNQPANTDDVRQLADLLAQNPEALEEILTGRRNDRQEPK